MGKSKLDDVPMWVFKDCKDCGHFVDLEPHRKGKFFCTRLQDCYNIKYTDACKFFKIKEDN